MRLLVMPSAPTEGLPTVILEAMACGTPVLATPIAGVPDVVQDEVTGYLLTDSRPGAIIDRINQILEGDEVIDQSLAAHELIEHEYTFDAAVCRYTRIYKDIVTSANS